MATPSTRLYPPHYRNELPGSIDSTIEEKARDQDPLPSWNSGSDAEGSAVHPARQPIMNSINPVRIKIDSSAHDLSINLTNALTDLDAAHAAAAQMNLNNQASTSVNTDDTQDTTALSPGCETSYINGCIAGSVALFCLSVVSFVMPSIPAYQEERATVQGLGYTAGVIALLSSVAMAACVVSVHTKSSRFQS